MVSFFEISRHNYFKEKKETNRWILRMDLSPPGKGVLCHKKSWSIRTIHCSMKQGVPPSSSMTTTISRLVCCRCCCRRSVTDNSCCRTAGCGKCMRQHCKVWWLSLDSNGAYRRGAWSATGNCNSIQGPPATRSDQGTAVPYFDEKWALQSPSSISAEKMQRILTSFGNDILDKKNSTAWETFNF